MALNPALQQAAGHESFVYEIAITIRFDSPGSTVYPSIRLGSEIRQHLGHIVKEKQP